MWADLCTREQVVDAVDETVQEVLREVGIVGPTVDVLQLARALDFMIALDATAGGRARFCRLGPAAQGVILIRHDPRPERRQWAVAHELGEIFAHRVFGRLGWEAAETAAVDDAHAPIDQTGQAREAVANQFAGALLVPTRWLRETGSAVNWDLRQLKREFVTASHELIARRMLDMPPPVVITIFDQGRVSWRRSNQRLRPGPLTDQEELVWLQIQNAEAVTRFDRNLPLPMASISGWAIHEGPWRREILRTELWEA